MGFLIGPLKGCGRARQASLRSLVVHIPVSTAQAMGYTISIRSGVCNNINLASISSLAEPAVLVGRSQLILQTDFLATNLPALDCRALTLSGGLASPEPHARPALRRPRPENHASFEI